MQRLREASRRARVSYEIFPVLPYHSEAAPIDWFEVALHAETDVRKPLDRQESSEAVAVLTDLAEFLTRHIPADGAFELDLSAWYYTAQPPPAADSLCAPRLFRSLSLVLFNIPPYRNHEEPPLLGVLRTQLQTLDISCINAEMRVPAGIGFSS